jgi:hypothetical protein
MSKNWYQKDKDIVELPMLRYYEKFDDGITKWFAQVQNMFFFKNQTDVFDCYLLILNDKLYLSYRVSNNLSYNFMKFVLKELPKNPQHKKRKFYKPTFL